MLLLSRFSRVRLYANPQTAATRLPRPWDSPGKNTGVGCHFLLQCMKVKSESEVVQSSPTPSDAMDCSLLGSKDIYGRSQIYIECMDKKTTKAGSRQVHGITSFSNIK